MLCREPRKEKETQACLSKGVLSFLFIISLILPIPNIHRLAPAIPEPKQVVSGSDDQTVRLWDAATGAPLQTLEGHISLVSSVAFSPDGSKLLRVLQVSNY